MPPGGKHLPLPLTWCVSLISFYLFYPPKRKLLLEHWQPRLTRTPNPWYRYFFAYFTLSTFCFQGMKRTTWPLLMRRTNFKKQYGKWEGGVWLKIKCTQPFDLPAVAILWMSEPGQIAPFLWAKVPTFEKWRSFGGTIQNVHLRPG